LNYKVEKPIGQGKFAVVYRAKHIDSSKPIALKVIKVFDQMDQVQREKCFKEIKLLKSVEHPNIVK
jgi:NIMA (never in mitosis gene a)-related kinase